MKICKECAKKFVAEMFGTFVLTFFGCSAAAISNGLGLGMLGVALAFGLSVVAMAYVIGNVSGCHINPAISFGCYLTKRIDLKQFIGYFIAQLLGAVIAAFLLYFVASQMLLLMNIPGGIAAVGVGSNGYGTASAVQLTAAGAAVVEILLTMVFVFTVLGVTSSKRTSSVAGIVIGLTLAFVHIIGIPFTGTSVNPARSFGPALVQAICLGNSVALKQVWLFFAAPLAGAALAALLYNLLCKDGECDACKVEVEIEEEEIKIA